MAGQVLLAYEVHAVAQRGDQHHVARSVQADQLLERQRAVVVVHRRPVHRGVLAVHLAHQLVDALLERAVRSHVLARRDGDQHEHHSPLPFGVLVEERVERVQPFGDALRVVQPLHRQHHLAALVPLLGRQRLHRRLHFRRARGVAIARVVDAERERVHLHHASVHRQRAARVLDARHASAAGQEMAHVVVGMEADEVGSQHAADDLVAPRQRAERLVVGEGDVQEEPDGRIRQRLAQHRRKQHEVVVLDPQRVAGARFGQRCLAEPFVHAPVGLPFFFVEACELGEPVEQRPDGRVGEALVVGFGVAVVQEHRAAIALVERRGQPGALVVAHARVRVGPADPEVAVLLVQGAQARGQAAHAALELEAAFAVVLEAVGQPVRHDDQPPGLGRGNAARIGLRAPGDRVLLPREVDAREGKGERRVAQKGRRGAVSVWHGSPPLLSFLPL